MESVLISLIPGRILPGRLIFRKQGDQGKNRKE